MNHKTLCLFAVLTLSAVLLGCNPEPTAAPDAGSDYDAGPGPTHVPAQTIVEPTQFKNYGRFEAGELCVGSNVDGAPLLLRDQDRVTSIVSVTYGCFTLQPGLYEVEPGKVATYLGTPPKTGLLRIKNGLRYDLLTLYNKRAETDPQSIVYPTVYRNTEKVLPAGELCVDSDLGGAPFEIRDRDQIRVVTSVTTRCFTLPPGGYTVRFLKAVEREQIPASTIVQLKDGERLDVKGLYVR